MSFLPARYSAKPRLRKLLGMWSCSSGPLNVGWGFTPYEAYMAWGGQTWTPAAPMWPVSPVYPAPWVAPNTGQAPASSGAVVTANAIRLQ
jgi:hypothetical protein